MGDLGPGDVIQLAALGAFLGFFLLVPLAGFVAYEIARVGLAIGRFARAKLN